MVHIFGDDGTVKLSDQDEMVAVSNSLAILLGSLEEAFIVQKLHSLTFNDQGIVVGDDRWHDDSIEDWILKIPPITERKMLSYMSSLEKKGIIERKKLVLENQDRSNSEKKQAYYYRLDYERLSRLIDEVTASEDLVNDGGAE